jgi:hypothetical protein
MKPFERRVKISLGKNQYCDVYIKQRSCEISTTFTRGESHEDDQLRGLVGKPVHYWGYTQNWWQLEPVIRRLSE